MSLERNHNEIDLRPVHVKQVVDKNEVYVVGEPIYVGGSKYKATVITSNETKVEDSPDADPSVIPNNVVEHCEDNSCDENNPTDNGSSNDCIKDTNNTVLSSDSNHQVLKLSPEEREQRSSEVGTIALSDNTTLTSNASRSLVSDAIILSRVPERESVHNCENGDLRVVNQSNLLQTLNSPKHKTLKSNVHELNTSGISTRNETNVHSSATRNETNVHSGASIEQGVLSEVEKVRVRYPSNSSLSLRCSDSRGSLTDDTCSSVLRFDATPDMYDINLDEGQSVTSKDEYCNAYTGDTGHSDIDTVGHIDRDTGHIDVDAGHIDTRMTGHSDVDTGYNDVATGHIEVDTGRSDVGTLSHSSSVMPEHASVLRLSVQSNDLSRCSDTSDNRGIEGPVSTTMVELSAESRQGDGHADVCDAIALTQSDDDDDDIMRDVYSVQDKRRASHDISSLSQFRLVQRFKVLEK